MRRRLIPVLIAVTLGAASTRAQMPQILEPPAKPWPQIMVVGTVHLANPGADAVTTKIDDVLSPERQQQIGAVVDGLARYKPTKIDRARSDHGREREYELPRLSGGNL